MPNTKSAERRVRSNARKQQHNRSVVSKLRRVEKEFRAAVAAGKKEEAIKLLPGVHSAFRSEATHASSNITAVSSPSCAAWKKNSAPPSPPAKRKKPSSFSPAFIPP